MKPILLGLGLGLLGPALSAQAALIDNDVTGDGRWEVDVLAGGESRLGNLDAVGEVEEDLIFDYFHYVDTGSGGVRLSNTSITSGPTITGDDEVTSSGSFAGENGVINWRTVSRIATGSTLYETELTFTSEQAFGNVELVQYLDEDVFSVSDDILIQLGTPGAGDFNLLTIDDDRDVGVSHAATYNTAVGMNYIGWAADEFSDLRSRITGGTQSYSIPGVIDTASLTPTSDARFPGAPAWGPEDITSAIAFLFDPNATFASTIFTLGGAPEGTPPPPPEDDEPGTPAIPVPASLFLLGVGLLGLGILRRDAH